MPRQNIVLFNDFRMPEFITISLFIGVLLAYLLGSIPTSVWIGKISHGIDVREHGSGNAGATNTFRILGAKYAIPVLLFDTFKGWIAVKLSFYFGNDFLSFEQLISFQLFLGIAAVVGHVFPIYANFRGGKGIATLLGVAIAIFPTPLLVVMGLFVVVFVITEYVSLGSIISAVAFPFIVVLLFNIEVPSLVIFSIAIAIFIPITHKKNIKRLLRGEEAKIKIWNRRDH